jgi:predicted metalloprotease with PDZ domain
MHRKHPTSIRLAAAALVLVAAIAARAAERPAAIAFTVSAPQAASHLFHVVMRCGRLAGDHAEFRMPAWTPGYYGLFDFAGNVRNFSAVDASGRSLTWQKTGASAWTVQTDGAASVELRYDVLATRAFVANAYVDDTRGYILPGALFLYLPNRLREPVTVTVLPPPAWPDVATGLDRTRSGAPHAFAAPDFDVLYDSPILMGRLESLPPFDVRGVRHDFVGYEPGEFDRAAFMKDLKAVVEAGVDIIGEVPYSHYVFLGIGPGQGGIEHLNSAAVSFSRKPDADRAAHIRELSFLAHEYFHNYNVKRVRPVALGPFDYDRANETDMLWVSEGFTVYYEYLMLARSGRMTLDEVLAALGRNMAAYENNPGRLFQSAAASSRETWTQGPFGRKDGRVRKTISYYEKGPVLGMLLDFRIRHDTRNARSLDTVMRELYRTYYKALARGWTDREFRETCERVAGGPLDEVFDYAATTREIDYPKYLAYAGLELEPPVDRPEPFTGAVVEDRDGRLVVAAAEPRSPAAATLAAGDVLVAVDGGRVDANGFDALVAARQPGDRLRLSIERAGESLDLPLTVGHRVERTFRMTPMAHPSALQSAILASWTAASR